MRRSEEREIFVIQTKADPTLKVCKDLAEKVKGCHHWSEDIHFQCTTDETQGDVEAIVAPKYKRPDILRTAHDCLAS